MFEPVHRPQNCFEKESPVVVVPRAGRARDAFQRRRRRDVGSAQPHIDMKAHTRIPSNVAASLTDAWHGKSRHTYAAAPLDGFMAARKGISAARRSRCSSRISMVIANGR